MFAERVGPIFWKKEMELFVMSFLLSTINYEIWGAFFFVVTFIVQFVNGGPSFYIYIYIFDAYLLNFDS